MKLIDFSNELSVLLGCRRTNKRGTRIIFFFPQLLGTEFVNDILAHLSYIIWKNKGLCKDKTNDKDKYRMVLHRLSLRHQINEKEIADAALKITIKSHRYQNQKQKKKKVKKGFEPPVEYFNERQRLQQTGFIDE